MDRTLVLPAPGKINLMLRVLGQRADGYHALQTVMQFISHSDRLTLSRRVDDKICLRCEGMPVHADNLTVRAARALRQWSGKSLGVDIHLEKRLPVEAGLGGGSSDAATVLFGLNVLWRTGLDLVDLESLGLSLGADVPFFLRGRSAWAEGVGERLTELKLPERYCLIICPGECVATRSVFSSKKLTRDGAPTTIRAFMEGERGNDCLSAVCALFPKVALAFAWLSRAAARDAASNSSGACIDWGLTGTGACLFATFDNRSDALALLAKIPDSMTGYVTRTCNDSPLHVALTGASPSG